MSAQPQLCGTVLSVPQLTGTVVDGFNWAVWAQPDKTAVWEASDGSSLSFAELKEKVTVTARALRDLLGSQSNQNPDGDYLVALCLGPSTDFITLVLSVMQIGAAYVALDVSYPSSRIEYIVEDCKPMLIVSQVDMPESISNTYLTVTLDELKLKEKCSHSVHQPTLVRGNITPESVAVVLYTSGSSGVPKGVRIPHRALLNRLAWQWHTFPYQQDEIGCFKTTSTFVDSLCEIFCPLLIGRSLLVIPKSTVTRTDTLVELLHSYRVRRLVLVPTLLRAMILHCVDQPVKDRLPHLKLWVCSAETLPSDLLKKFFDVFKNSQSICNFYGSTEVLGDVTFIQFKNHGDVMRTVVNNSVPIGEVVSNNTVFLDSSAPDGGVPDEGIGELCVYGRSLALGYVNLGHSDRFYVTNINGKDELAYRTGDYGRVIRDLLYYEGRKDSQIKVRGHRVDCSEVQRAVSSMKGIKGCAILCYKPGTVQQELLAFCCLSESVTISAAEISADLSSKLPSYMMPQIRIVPEIPLLTNGKVDRQQLLRDFEQDVIEHCPEFELPHLNDRERQVASDLLKVVCEVLGSRYMNSGLSLSDSFFSIGGDSLNVVLVVSGLQELGHEISLSEFLNGTSLLDVVDVICSKSEAQPKEDGQLKGSSSKYICEPIDNSVKDIVCRMVALSFTTKSKLEVSARVKTDTVEKLFGILFDSLVEQGLSFVVKDSTGQCLAVSANFDLHCEPPLEVTPPVSYVFDFLEDVESKVRHLLPSEAGEVIHSFVMATADHMSNKENTELIYVMESRNIELAKEKNYKAIFATNTSETTQLVCCNVFKYKVLSETPMSTYVASDGTTPFSSLSDNDMSYTSVYYV